MTTLSRADLRAVLERYIAGEKPAAIAAALGLDAAEVERLCLPPTSAGAVAKAIAAPRPKRAKRAPADAPAPRSEARGDDFADTGNMSARRDGVTSHRNAGYGYATVRGGGRRWL